MIPTIFTIPFPRLVAYVAAIALLPFLVLLFPFFSQKKEIDALRERIHSLYEMAIQKEKREEGNWAVYRTFGNADHFYLDKYVESISLLEREVEDLQRIVEDKNFANDSRINHRLQFLTSEENHISFVEGAVQTTPFFQETVETLARPVEIDGEDLRRLLCVLERRAFDPLLPPDHSPQLLITEWKLDRKTIYENYEVFTLHCKLVKREFL